MSGGFLVPEEQEWLDAFGVGTEQAGDEPWIRSVRIPLLDGDELEISYDQFVGSVGLSWASVQSYREGAVRLMVETTPGVTTVRAEFGLGELHGTLALQVYPELRLTDQLLR